MKLGLLPLFRAESFSPEGFTATGLEYISANVLSEITAFVQAQFPDIQLELQLALSEMLRQRPDIVLLWSTSSCFQKVAPTAESIKTYLDIPVWLAGPHISYVPQMLPPDVDIGIIGEVELPLQQLLKIYLKQPNAGPMQYRSVPGIVYQSKGRMYSGAPAQILPQLTQLPVPQHTRLQLLPGMSAPVIRTSRSSDALLPALAYPPSRKPRLYSPEQICAQFSQIVGNYQILYKSLPIPANLRHYVSPVMISDYAFVLQRQRLEALIPMFRSQGLHELIQPLPNIPPEALTPELISQLKSLNVRSVMFVLGPFQHRNPLIPSCTPEQLEQALALCKQHQISVLAQLFINPDVSTSRSQLAQTYLFLRNHLEDFQKVTISVLGTLPGTPVWEQYTAKVKPDVTTLQHLHWQSLDLETFAYDIPIYHSQLNRDTLSEIYYTFKRLVDEQKPVMNPMHNDMFNQARALAVRDFVGRYLRPGETILEVPMQPELALKPLLPQFKIHQLSMRKGQLNGNCPEPVDFILLNGTLNCLRDPEAALKQLKIWLKPDGRIMLQWLNPLHMRTLNQFFNWQTPQSTARNPVLKYLKLEEVEAMLKRCGLEPGPPDYTIIEDVENVRPAVESLATKIEHHASLRIPQHMLYASEIKMLVRNRT